MPTPESSSPTTTIQRSCHLSEDPPPIIVFPPVLWLAAAVVGTALQWCWPIHLGAHGWVRSAGAALTVLGTSFVIVSNVTLRRAGTSVNPSKPTTTIVKQGIFRLSRNPMYLSGTLAYLGLALLLNAFWPLIALIPSLA